jgi:L,D-transpeptidase YcbB
MRSTPLRLLVSCLLLVACSSEREAEGPTRQTPQPSGPAPAPARTGAPDDPLEPAVRSGLEALVREVVEESNVDGVLVLGREAVLAGQAVFDHYAAREFAPGFTDGKGLVPLADELLAVIRAVDEHGLRPNDYHLEAIEEYRQLVQDETTRDHALVSLDLLLTDAFLTLGGHLLEGKVDPVAVHPQWSAERREVDLPELLSKALAQRRVAAALEDLAPSQGAYARLRASLKRHRELAAAGGWAPVKAGAELALGSSGPRVDRLRARLAATGDLSAAGEGPFDEVVAEGVRRFQARHGLRETGVADVATVRALDVPVERRIDQILASLERWRWLPSDLGSRHLLVNIPSFELRLIEDAEVVEQMKVVVGKSYRKTPVMSAELESITINPGWSVPHKIAYRDILPKIRKNPGYLSEHGLRVYDRFTGAGPLDPSKIDWKAIEPKRFPYKLRQDAGPKNALGSLKFTLPNPYSIFLHDTPRQDAFSKDARALSSGCIRLERPVDLAQRLLQEASQWSRDAIEAAIRRRSERTVQLSEPVPVHLLYWTAFAEADGTVHFRPDVYQRDAAVLAALDEAPPTAQDVLSRLVEED